MLADCGKKGKRILVLNATGSDHVLLDLAFAPEDVKAFDTYGKPVPASTLAAGLNAVRVPEGGYLSFR